jgi:hypothetical protein
VDGFLEEVGSAWHIEVASENPFKRLAVNLAATAKALTSWNNHFIGSNKQILMANKLILRLDMAMESRVLSLKDRGFWKLLKLKLLGVSSLERTFARHRLRIT